MTYRDVEVEMYAGFLGSKDSNMTVSDAQGH